MVGYGMTAIDSETAETENFAHTFKVVFIGDAGTGKSACIGKFARGMFTPTYMPTIGIDFAIKIVNMNGQLIKLQLWDTSGESRYRSITTAYYRGAQGVFIFFDLTNRESFESVTDWKSEINKYAAEDVSVLLVGTKADLEGNRKVEAHEIQELSERLGLEYVEFSIKTGDYEMNKMFERMVEKMMYARRKQDEDPPLASKIVLKGPEQSKSCFIL